MESNQLGKLKGNTRRQPSRLFYLAWTLTPTAPFTLNSILDLAKQANPQLKPFLQANEGRKPNFLSVDFYETGIGADQFVGMATNTSNTQLVQILHSELGQALTRNTRDSLRLEPQSNEENQRWCIAADAMGRSDTG
jgi:hypothetical protein